MERLAAIKCAGFGATSLWWNERAADGTAALGDEVAMVRDAGLHLDYLHVPFERCNELWCDDAAIRDAIVSEHRRWLDACAQHGVDMIVMHVSAGLDLPSPSAAGVASMRRIADMAAERQIRIAVENTRRPDYLSLVLAEVPDAHVGFCFDSSHAWLEAHEGAGPLADYGQRLMMTHFSDNDGAGDRHWLPGDGIVDWQDIAAAFPHGVYTGSIHLEIVAREAERAQPLATFLAEAYRRGVWLQQQLAATTDTLAQT